MDQRLLFDDAAPRAGKGAAGGGSRLPGAHPPVEGFLSCVIVCSNNEEDVALEVKRLLAMAQGVPCVVFGLRADLQLARSALKAGARGFIHAEMHPERVVCALSLASKGEVVLPGELLEEAAE